jgi:hypothetical protein
MTAELTDEQLDWVAKFTDTPRAALAKAKGHDADDGENGKGGKGGNGAAPPNGAAGPNGAAPPNGADPDTPQRAKYSPPAQSRQPTLRKGDESPDGWVEYLQELLKVTVTGKFDGATEKAVKAFQGSHGCMVDGVVGNETWSVLRHEKKEAVGTDGRDPHSFEQAGVQARFFLEDKFVVYDKGSDSVSFIIESVGDQTDISKNKATFRITPPGGSGQTVELTIGAPTKKSPDGQGNQHTVTIDKLKATYPAEAGAQGNYKIEGYLESAIGGDRWSGDVLDKAPAPPPQPHGGPPKPKVITLPEITIHGNVPIDVTITALNFAGEPLSGYAISVVFNASSEDRVSCAGTLQMGSTTISGVQVPPSGSVFFEAASDPVYITGAANYKRNGTEPIRFRAVQTKKTKTVTATSGKEASDKVGVSGTVGVQYKVSVGIPEVGSVEGGPDGHVEGRYDHEEKTSSSEAMQYTVEWGGNTWATFEQA